MTKTSKTDFTLSCIRGTYKVYSRIDYIETEEYIFVHAVEPMKRVSESEPYTLMYP